MTQKFTSGYIIGIVIGVLLLITSNNTIAAQDQNNNTTTIAGQNQFNPVPFNEIPLIVINSSYGEY